MNPLVLVGTEDVEFYLFLDHVLEAEGFHSVLASGLKETLTVALKRVPGVIVLDCNPQSFSATETFDRLKRKPKTESIPVVALISNGAEMDHVQLLKSGIDDAFTRPFSPAKLIERIRILLTGEHRASAALTYADVEMDLTVHRVHRNGKEIHLGPIEYKLLQHLLQSPEQVFSRDELIGAAWPSNVHVGPRTVDVHIGQLRRALMSVARRDLIRTVRAAGYSLTDQEEDATPKKE